jgi:threonine dehydratase
MPPAPSLEEIRRAAEALQPYIVATPLLRLSASGPADIYLKLENLQSIGAFKVRCMGYAVLARREEAERRGVYTASSGNAGLGLAWMARELNIAATVYAPDDAPANKLEAVRALGATVRTLAFADWWQIIRDAGHPGDAGLYVDAVRDPAALAGNATLGLEIATQLPGVATVLAPFGGGGLACGVASALRFAAPGARLLVAESEAATPVGGALAAGRPVEVPMRASFISGAGSPRVLDEMWPLVRELVAGTVTVSLPQVADALRLLFDRAHVVGEGAAGTAVAAALTGQAGPGPIVCVVTGGNLSRQDMITLLKGGVP